MPIHGQASTTYRLLKSSMGARKSWDVMKITPVAVRTDNRTPRECQHLSLATKYSHHYLQMAQLDALCGSTSSNDPV